MSHPPLLLMSFAALALVIISGCTDRPAMPDQSVGAVVREVALGNFATIVSVTGKIGFSQESALTFGSEGTVIEVPVQWGDEVESGDLIARLETGDLELAVAKAETNLVNAQEALKTLLEGATEAELAKAEASVESAEASLMVSQNNLIDLESDYSASYKSYGNVFKGWVGIALSEEEILMSPDRILHTRGIDLESMFQLDARPFKLPQFSNAGETPIDDPSTSWDEQIVYAWVRLFPGTIVISCEGQQPLIKAQQGRCINQELEDAWDNYRTADEKRAKGRAEVENLIADRARANESLNELRRPPEPTRVKERQQQVTGTEAALAEARNELIHATIRAPFDGIVTEVNVEVGQRIASKAIVAMLVDPLSVEIAAEVDEVDVVKILPRQRASVTLDAMPDFPVKAMVEKVSIIGRTQSGVVSYDVRLSIPSPSAPTFRKGMTVVADIAVERIDDVLLVPIQAVQNHEGARGVMVLVGEEEVFQPVQFGQSNSRFIVALNGLIEGDQVLVPRSPGSLSDQSQNSGRFSNRGILGNGRDRSP